MARPVCPHKPKATGAILGLRRSGAGRKLHGMKIGLLSDTHNHLRETRNALALLRNQGVRHLVHCGDAGEDVVDLLAAAFLEQGLRSHVAIGNCDRPQAQDVLFAPAPAGVERAEAPEFVLAGKHCLVLHGDDARRLEQASHSGAFDYVFTGHTHAPADLRVGKTRILNPGSPVRPRRGPPTVAVLDLATDAATWLAV